MATETPTQHGPDRALTWFSVMWVAAGLFHLANQAPWIDKPWTIVPYKLTLEVLLVVVGLRVLTRPTAWKAFLVFITLEALHGLSEFPRVANHWMLTTACALAMWSAAALPLARGTFSPTTWWRDFGPGVRWIYLVGYSFAAIAKLNTDFLDPEVSCASTSWVGIMEYFGLPWLNAMPFQLLAIGATVVVELSLPLALCIPRLRAPAILMGLVFHYLISFTPILRVPDFAAFLMASWLLFLSPRQLDVLAGGLARLRTVWGDVLPALTARRLIAGVLMFSVLGFIPALMGLTDGLAWFNQLRLNAFTVYGLVAIIVLVLCMKELWHVEAHDAQSLRLRDPMAVVLVLLMVAIGTAPYVGHRTSTNLSMFSNLRTEGGVSNHVVVPTWYAFDYQNDLVEIVETDIPRLNLLMEHGDLLPMWEMVYTTSHHPDGHVTYRRGGETVVVPRVGDVADLARMPDLWERWTLSFRPVTLAGKSTCKW
ncbi:MAG: hypothetical protein ACON5B_15690 [Myxococcota bacterium]